MPQKNRVAHAGIYVGDRVHMKHGGERGGEYEPRFLGEFG
jgi:hypothetical protein